MLFINVIGTPQCGKSSLLEVNSVSNNVIVIAETPVLVAEGKVFEDGVVNGIVVLFDCTSKQSFEQSIPMVAEALYHNPGITVVWTATKVDSAHRKILWRSARKRIQTTFASFPNLKYAEVSAISNYNITKPFEHIVNN